MLIRFIVSNFLSFKEETEFNMLTGNYKIHKGHVYRKNGIDLVKAAAIYGANGAGKSNLVQAIATLQNFIAEGEIDFWKDEKFRLDKSFMDKPVSMQIEFAIEKNILLYTLIFDEDKVYMENLYKTNYEKEEMIFERKTLKTGKTALKLHSKYSKTQKDKIMRELYEEELLTGKKLFIHFAQRKYTEIGLAFKWLTGSLIIIYPDSSYNTLTFHYDKIQAFRQFLNLLIPMLDTGIKSIEMEMAPLQKYLGDDEEDEYEKIVAALDKGEPFKKISGDGGYSIIAVKENNKYLVKKIVAKHKGSDKELYKFDLLEESEGTVRLFDILPPLFSCIYNGSTVIIDELDSSLHPYLLKRILELFMAAKTSGQLIFTTHESNLLDLNILRQDEIWFAEKDKSGATQFTSLNDFKPRYDADIRKGYLNGRFGAIPFLGNLDNLNWPQHEKAIV